MKEIINGMKVMTTMMVMALLAVVILTTVSAANAIEVEEVKEEKTEVYTWFTGEAAAEASAFIYEQRTLDDSFSVISIDFEVVDYYTVSYPRIAVNYINDTVFGSSYFYW